MRMVGTLLVGTLGLAVIAQGAYIFKTRRQVAELSDRFQQLAQEREQVWGAGRPAAFRPATPDLDDGDDDLSPGASEARLPPPRFVVQPQATDPSAPHAALPAMLDNPQAREQLRQFVAAELQRERDETRERQRQRRQQEEQERIQNMAKTLNLNPDETRRFGEVFAAMQTSREQLRQRMESGELQREQIGREFQTLREQHRQQLQGILGDERMKKMDEMRRGGGPGGGGARGWGGGDRRRGEGQRGDGQRGGAPPPGAAP